ncbi:MAG: type IV pilus assembly protein PilM [Verrucomicrobiaceae bacterium]|nr:type IV pilus assembly protein PilM [Verrucomicrobiaceae bacterium]
MADNKNLVVLNLGSQRVGGAVFSKTSRGELVLKKYEFVEMMGDPSVDATRLPQLKVAVAELADNLKLKGHQAWYAVAGHLVFSRFVKLPPVQGERVGQIVEFEARQQVPFPLNEVAWDYDFITEDPVEKEVMIVAMKMDALNEINDIVSNNGVKTVGVDLAPTCVYNAFRYSYPDADEPCVIVDLGARSTNLIFAEGEKMFTRNILVGGASVTGAIAKEFGYGFGDAENQKCTQGFVALGGTVEDHADAGIAALSKVIRNAVTRLHGEVLRTITHFRSQQGGSQPKRIFLCGGGSQLAYLAEFFQEKFKLPVEIFNPLRGVQLAPGVNAEAAAADAHGMAEMVGLALRSSGSCPVEVELVPDAVELSRDTARRAPALVMAGLCTWAMFGAGIAYFNKAGEATQSRVAEVEAKVESLKDLSNNLAQIDVELNDLKAQSAQFEAAVNDRSYWVRMLTDLNNKFDSDLLWLTLIEPLKDGRSMTLPQTPEGAAMGSATGSGNSSLFETPPAAEGADAFVKPADPAATGSPPTSAPTGAPPTVVAPYSLRIMGLYRRNDEGQEVVYRYARALASSEFFAVENIAEKLGDYCKAESGAGEEERYAYKFELRLPLKNPMEMTLQAK